MCINIWLKYWLYVLIVDDKWMILGFVLIIVINFSFFICYIFKKYVFGWFGLNILFIYIIVIIFVLFKFLILCVYFIGMFIIFNLLLEM